MNAKFISALALVALMLPLHASADETESALGGFGGTVIYENSVGMGTFTPGEFTRQPYWNMLLSIRPSYVLSQEQKIKAHLRLDFNQNIVENFQSLNTRPHDVNLGDLRFYVTWGDLASIKEANLKFTGAAFLYFPTSRLSQITGKLIGTRLSTSGKWSPASWFSMSYGFGVTKNFHEFTNPTVDVSEFDAPLPTRANGSEQVGEALVATGTQNTEWTLNHSVSLSFMPVEKLSIDIGFAFYHLFHYSAFEKDELSSVNATAGRGYNEIMVGSVEVSYQVTDWLGLALGTSTEQLPKTADNSGIRFPFWDTTNGAANRQSFYLDAVASF